MCVCVCVWVCHLGVLVTHDPAEQEDDDDGDRDRDADDHYGVGFLGCLQATVVPSLEFVVFAGRRARKLAMHTQTTRNKIHRVVSCFLISVFVQPLLKSEAVVRQASTFRMHPFDLSWQGANTVDSTGDGTGALTVTVCWTYVVGATKAVASTTTGTPRS